MAQKPFRATDALAAPFMNQLTAAPAKHRVAWCVDDEGKRMFYLHGSKIYIADVADTAKQPEQLVIAAGHASQLGSSL